MGRTHNLSPSSRDADNSLQYIERIKTFKGEILENDCRESVYKDAPINVHQASKFPLEGSKAKGGPPLLFCYKQPSPRYK